MDLMRKVYLTQQEMLKFMKEKRQDSLSPNLRKYYDARQEMNDWLEKDDVLMLCINEFAYIFV